MSYASTDENHSTEEWTAVPSERQVAPPATDQGALYVDWSPSWREAERTGADSMPATEALQTDLPLLHTLKPGAVTVAPSSHRPGRQARPALARTRTWLYSFSLATKIEPTAPPASCSRASALRLRWAR